MSTSIDFDKFAREHVEALVHNDYCMKLWDREDIARLKSQAIIFDEAQHLNPNKEGSGRRWQDLKKILKKY
jgi:hypothetical protein